MQKYVDARKFDFRKVQGLTAKQLSEHYELYSGYVKKINDIWGILSEEKKYANSNPTYSDLRSLNLGQSFALNGVKLHEMYFENIKGGLADIDNSLLKHIVSEYGSIDLFINRVKETALSIRGWVVVCVDSISDKICIFGCDAHDVGSIWMSKPIIVLDMYEHAYFLDFGINKSAYIDVFFKNLSWDVVNNRYKNTK